MLVNQALMGLGARGFADEVKVRKMDFLLMPRISSMRASRVSTGLWPATIPHVVFPCL
jgi:hypothetical protein